MQTGSLCPSGSEQAGAFWALGQVPCRFLLSFLRRHDLQRCWVPAGATRRGGSPGGSAPLRIRPGVPARAGRAGQGGKEEQAVLADAQTQVFQRRDLPRGEASWPPQVKLYRVTISRRHRRRRHHRHRRRRHHHRRHRRRRRHHRRHLQYLSSQKARPLSSPPAPRPRAGRHRL